MGWYLRYLSLHGDRSYGSLFPTDPDLCVGEVGPLYARLNEGGVAHTARLIGDGKIIYILRNPIERSWSAAAMHIRNVHRIAIDEASDSQIRYILDHPSTRQSADYVRHIALWQKYFGKSNVHIALYDDLCADPRSFFRAILEFLEVESTADVIPATVDERIGKHNHAQITDPHLNHLCDLHRDQIQDIHRYLDNEHTAAWLQSACRDKAYPGSG